MHRFRPGGQTNWKSFKSATRQRGCNQVAFVALPRRLGMCAVCTLPSDATLFLGKAVAMARRKLGGLRVVLTEIDSRVPIQSIAADPRRTYVTAEEAARIAGVGTRYIYVMLREKRVKALWVGARRVDGQMKGGRCLFNLASVTSADVCRSHCRSQGRRPASV